MSDEFTDEMLHQLPIETREIGLSEVLWGPDVDSDCDELSNAMVCYLGLDPRVFNKSPFTYRIVDGKLRIRWYRSAGVQGITMGYEISPNLSSWAKGTAGTGVIGDVGGIFEPIGCRLQVVLVPMTTDERYVRFFCETQ